MAGDASGCPAAMPQWQGRNCRKGAEDCLLRLLRDDVISAWGQDEGRLALAEEPRARRASELIFATIALVYPAWHWVFRAVMPEAHDPLFERLGISAIMVAAIVAFRFRR